MSSATATVLAGVPDDLLAEFAAGKYERVGMLIRDTATKRIKAHLQETGATEKVFSGLLERSGGLVRNLSPDPINAVAGVATVVQNEQIKSRLNVLETMMGGLQSMQAAAIVTSVAGIGVTVASTAIILSRLDGMSKRLDVIGDAVERQQEKSENWDLASTLAQVKDKLEFLAEAELSKDPAPRFERAEEALHEGFGKLHFGVTHVLKRATVDPEFLSQMIAVLSLCSVAQIRTLIWLDEKERARERAMRQTRRLEEIAMAMPLDKLTGLFSGNAVAAGKLDGLASDMRLRLASVPTLADSLIRREVNGRAYLERAAGETSEPLLMVDAG